MAHSILKVSASNCMDYFPLHDMFTCFNLQIITEEKMAHFFNTDVLLINISYNNASILTKK